MAVEEKRFQRNGVPFPIHILLMEKSNRLPRLTLHYHDYFELLYGVSGENVAAIGTKEYLFGAGDLILIRNGQFHGAMPSSKGASYIVIKFLPSVLYAEGHTFIEYSYTRLLLQSTENKFFFSRETLAETPIPALPPRILSEWEAADFGYELSLRADITQIMLHIMRIWQKENPALALPPVSAAQGGLIQKALSYAEAHYTDLTEEGCAHALGVSPAYLSRVFKRGMGTSFTAYTTALKLKEAEKQLLGSEDAITEIAERIGFSTVAYFIAAFRTRYGYTPARYRRLLREKQL